MAVNIWPSANDIAVVAGDGSKVLEQAIASHIKLITDTNFIYSGMVLTDGGGLFVDVPLGVAYMDGHFVEYTSTTSLALTANSTNYIWAQLTYDGGGNADAATFLVNTTGVPVGETLLLGTAITDASSITSFGNLTIRKNVDPFTRKTYVDDATINRIIDYTANHTFSVPAGGSQGGVVIGMTGLTLGDFVWATPTSDATVGMSYSAHVKSPTELYVIGHNAGLSAFGATISMNYRIFTFA